MRSLAARILDVLPQTQCSRCGYPDCAAYADAIAQGAAGINQCPPGGADGIRRLARITGQPTQALDPQFGIEGPRALAVIDEAWCIGCTLCLAVCPTDAIVGINKQMHTVIEPHCTGCELCIPVCPVDCISLEVATPGRSGWQAWSPAQADAARERYEVHVERRRQDSHPRPGTPENEAPTPPTDRKLEIVQAAMARARAARTDRAKKT
jgi:electron transport complex protein RnfB